MKRRWRRERSREWGEFGDAERLHGRRCNSHMNPQITHKLTNGSEGSADLKRAKLCTHVGKTLQCTPGEVRQGRAPQPYLGYRHSLLPSRIPACTFIQANPPWVHHDIALLKVSDCRERTAMGQSKNPCPRNILGHHTANAS